MADHRFLLTWILFFSYCLLTVHCSQPNCTDVRDFDDCRGNAADICPENITCACKDGKPFCKCPNYRGKWGNYWYMGDKCEQLWNTLDLVLVATLPGIGLALIVAVTIKSIDYCRRMSKKNTDDHREQIPSSGLQPQHNLGFAFGTDMRLPQHNQDQVNTETRLSNKVYRRHQGEKCLRETEGKKNFGKMVKERIRDNKMKCYQKINLPKH
ncbi:uncharacterized protein LOC125343038 [Perognathus longimembris pacificus]|uniref:uncharacterized protein LOC125343038 n=1 Tax=Perognathus longimembris pacificus TaxID=214514 RepID=UPI0020199FF3|nr:uncharacterized protein LOC125343038 [Perognathus longimembris pacificus]